MTVPPIIPREVLFGNPERMSVRLSPDGRRIAYVAPSSGVLNVWIRSRDGGDDKVVTRDSHRGIREFFWAYDGKHLCYVQDKDGDENWRVYSVDLETEEVRDLTPFEGVQARPVDWSPERPNDILVALNRDNPELHDLYRIGLDSGEVELVVRNPGAVLDYTVDRRLNLRGGSAMAEDGGSIVLSYDAQAGQWTPVVRAPFGENLAVLGMTPDENGFYLYSSLDCDTSRILTVDIVTGEQKVLAERAGVDADGNINAHPTKRHIQAVSFTYARQEWQFLDASFENDFSRFASLEDGDMDIASRDLNDQWWIVVFTQDLHPAKYYLVNRETGESRYLFSMRPDLEKYTLCPMKPVQIQSRDGLTMVCYLTLPVWKQAKNLPLVLNVHGGPWHRDSWGLDVESQWLANRGYAVLQVNFRGSTGFGKAFVNAADREWGAKMHDDLIDAVNWAVSEGIADADRVAIMGGSYGGYATLVGMTFTPEVFAVGVCCVGISNLISWIHSIPAYWAPFKEMLYKRVGHPDEEEFLKSRSPLFRVDNIRNPMLIAQGANDPRVPQAESDQIVEAMKSKGLDVEYLLFEDEGHGFARPENRLKYYAAAEKFLSRALGGRCED